MGAHSYLSEQNLILLDMNIQEDAFQFATNIASAQACAVIERQMMEQVILDNLDTVRSLTPDCDKIDYILAASSGALCGIMDIFLVGKPGESPLGDITDKWFENRVVDFANLCRKKGHKKIDDPKSAIRYLEKIFKIPYDQTHVGKAAKEVFDLTTENHHFKSLAHNPSLCGLFFSILDQFYNESHFISDGALLTLEKASDSFVLRGKTVPGKLFYGFVNWIGHIMSDISGSSGSKGRGMGIPSPLWTWMNDIIAVKNKLGIPVSKFDKSFNDLAQNIYEQGYDARFQAAQAIPVFVNELVVRVLYSVRRMIRFYGDANNDRSFKNMLKACEPFSNASVKRMLTIAHGSFCLVDIGDATVRSFVGGGFNIAEFVMRLNVVGVGRFAVSLYGEANRVKKNAEVQHEITYIEREKHILECYMEGLKCLAEVYDDQELVAFVNDFKRSDAYIAAFEKSVKLAEKRRVPSDEILRDKGDIDSYFRGGSKNEH